MDQCLIARKCIGAVPFIPNKPHHTFKKLPLRIAYIATVKLSAAVVLFPTASCNQRPASESEMYRF